MATPAIKKKKVSKKSKASWRKNVSITDVEDFLEDQRLDERLGISFENASNDELFQIDTKPTQTTTILTSKEARKLRYQQPPKCFSGLLPSSKVPDPITKRNHVRTKEERKSKFIIQKEAEGILKPKLIQSVDAQRSYKIKRESRPKRGEFTSDIWSEENKTGIERDLWAEENTKKHNLIGTGKVRKTIKKCTAPKPTVLPSIEIPHPGMSYNPSYKDHQELLHQIAEDEKKRLKEEEHLRRVTSHMFCKVTREQQNANWLNEMSEGLIKKEEDNVKVEKESDDEYKPINPPAVNKKKTLKQRRKQKEHQQVELARVIAKREKKKVSDIHQLRHLENAVEKLEEKSVKVQEKRRKKKELKPIQTKRLNALKFEEADVDFEMASEITGSLRNLKKGGNVLLDRFKSLQKRNIIQPTIRRNRKQAKVKVYTKPGFKDDWMQTVARAKQKVYR